MYYFDRKSFSFLLVYFFLLIGTSANALNFQLYLLEGLNRWNQDRASAAVTSKPASLLTYSGDMVHCVNINSMKVFGRAFEPTFRPPAKYTGMFVRFNVLTKIKSFIILIVHTEVKLQLNSMYVMV